jgi:hypothetical protein
MAAWARPLNVETLAPPCRYQAAHCCTRDTLYLHGGGGQGADASQRRALLWALDLRTLRWSIKDGPRKSRVAARSQHTLTCTGDNKLVCFGGQGEGRNSIDWRKEVNDDQRREGQPVVRMLQLRQTLNDVSTFDLTKEEWKTYPIQGRWPTPRRGHTATLIRDSRMIAQSTASQRDAEAARGGDEDYEPATVNPARGFVVVIGGAGPDAGGRGFECVLGQVWSFDPVRGAWAELSGLCSGEHPPKRFEHQSVLVERHLIVIGGLANISASIQNREPPGLRDVLAWNVDTLCWSKIPTTHEIDESPRLYGHAACLGTRSNEILVFGGSTGDDDVRVLKLFGDQRPDLCGWRVAPCDGYRPTDDMKLGPYARLPREHHQAHQKQIAALPTQSVEAQKREKKRMRRKGKRRGRSKTPPPQPEAPPVDFCYREFPPAPRRGHILALHVPGRRSGTFTKPVVLCFGGALLGAGRGRVCEPDLSIYDPEAASDSAIERATARHTDIGGLVSTTGQNKKFSAQLQHLSSQRTGPQYGAKGEKAFLDAIKADLESDHSVCRQSSAGGQSYRDVKRLLSRAHKQRAKHRRHKKKAPDDASSVGSSLTGLSYGTTSSLGSRVSTRTLKSLARARRGSNYQPDLPRLIEKLDAPVITRFPTLKGLPRDYRPPRVTLEELQRVKAINQQTNNKAIAKRMWADVGMLEGEMDQFLGLMPREIRWAMQGRPDKT